jgi:hypothetical protein
MVEFYLKSTTDREGKPRDIEHVLIHHPGGDVTPLRVSDAHRSKYAAEYALFKAGKQVSKLAPANPPAVEFGWKVPPSGKHGAFKERKVYVLIRKPGTSEVIHRAATDEDKAKYAKPYAAFLAADAPAAPKEAKPSKAEAAPEADDATPAKKSFFSKKDK